MITTEYIKRYGPLTVERHTALKASGLDLHTFVRGEDVTSRCRYVDDVAQYAELYRYDDTGHAYLDEDGEPSVEIATADIVVCPLV